MSEVKARTVSWLVRQISARLDSDPVLHGVVLEAEVSNFHAHSSGHWYFSLKDERARIDATMWENDNLLVNFMPKDGDRIRVLGNVTIYQVQGKVQFTVRRMVRAGEGDLKAKFDALFKKLNEEGLFDPAYKQPIPKYPLKIALVTGSATHARADVYNTLARRWPAAEVTEYPALVQGENAPPELIAALTRADQGNHEVILLCRGGGSAEDLWCFNDEMLARTIHACRTPLITGIGHEPDWTIADYVADLRAPTPTGAAERATPDIREVTASLAESRRLLMMRMKQRLAEEENALDEVRNTRVLSDPLSLIRDRMMTKDLLEVRFFRQLESTSTVARRNLAEKKQALCEAVRKETEEKERELSSCSDALVSKMKRILEGKRNQLSGSADLLDAYSPLKVLGRGYSVVSYKGTVLKDASVTEVDDPVRIRLHKGILEARITGKHTEE